MDGSRLTSPFLFFKQNNSFASYPTWGPLQACLDPMSYVHTTKISLKFFWKGILLVPRQAVTKRSFFNGTQGRRSRYKPCMGTLITHGDIARYIYSTIEWDVPVLQKLFSFEVPLRKENKNCTWRTGILISPWSKNLIIHKFYLLEIWHEHCHVIE